MLEYGKKLTAEGNLTSHGTIDINASSIYSELIQAAGMGCEHFASDLLYDIRDIDSNVHSMEDGIFFIGIRTNGVDGNGFIKSRLDRKSCCYTPNAYIKLYRAEITVGGTSVTLTLERVTEYDVQKEMNIR